MESCCKKDRYGMYPSGCEDYMPKINISDEEEGHTLQINSSKEGLLDLVGLGFNETEDIIIVAGGNYTEIWSITYDGKFYWKGEYVQNYSDIADRLRDFFTNPTEFCGNYT